MRRENKSGHVKCEGFLSNHNKNDMKRKLVKWRKKASQFAGNKKCSNGKHNYLFQFSFMSLVPLIAFCFSPVRLHIYNISEKRYQAIRVIKIFSVVHERNARWKMEKIFAEIFAVSGLWKLFIVLNDEKCVQWNMIAAHLSFRTWVKAEKFFALPLESWTQKKLFNLQSF